MTSVNLQIKLDSELAASARELAKSMGFDVPTAVRMFIAQFVKERKLPFVPSEPDPFYSRENMDFLRKSLEQIQAGRCQKKTIEELDQMAK